MLFTDLKSDNNEEKCNQFKTFPEEDIRDLDDLIAKKYMNIKSFKRECLCTNSLREMLMNNIFRKEIWWFSTILNKIMFDSVHYIVIIILV
ncbi:unnamed protein product [Schistosoma mattheei]|uniref:Uncharacterized protein n=1 Tax=Schistosoma mattheei TaxID=31246 RepID=A0AA85AQ00_9TREM|nr:unnamed protein product [Schistosoma mattheei]